MCLLTFMPPNIDMDYERAKTAAKANPDGFGFAIHAGVAIIKDHDMNFDKLWLRWSDMRKTYRGAALFHFRIATHGNTDLGNCHPFDVDNNPRSVLAHNGMLPLTMPINDHRSDTKLFAEIVLPHIGGVKALDDKNFFDDVGRWASGNKMVILTVEEDVERDWYIINENLGHWDAGVWWSNGSYKAFSYMRTPMGYPSYSNGRSMYGGNPYKSGWDDYDYDDDYEWVKQPRSLAEDNDFAWTQEDELDLIEDELYPTGKTFEKICVFTDFSNVEYARITCYNCGIEYFVDAMEPVPTHCGECLCCFHCSNTESCECWDDYEYGEKYIVWNEKEGTISYEAKSKQQAS
jgi:hypothetical protein